MKNKRLRVNQFVWLSFLFATFTSGEQTSEVGEFDWLPVRCAPIETVGFHDEADSSELPVESFEIVQFSSAVFLLRQNETLGELLSGDRPHTLYLTLETPEDNDFFELTCKRVVGANRETGYSCVNTPPSDILLLNPKSMRFSRAAIGSWTFQSQNDLENGSSLFVQMGQCYSLSSESSSESN